MAEPTPNPMQMLLVEPETLLRRTVVMTARTLGIAHIHEAGSVPIARRMLRERVFHGAVIAVDFGAGASADIDLILLDQLRDGQSASDRAIPIAVLAERCNAEQLQALRRRAVSHVILKPFRARVLIDTFARFGAVVK